MIIVHNLPTVKNWFQSYQYNQAHLLQGIRPLKTYYP